MSETGGEGSSFRLRRLHVLVADDNPIHQRSIIALLDGAGHTATVAANGRQAVEAILREQFDIVLMDVQMPIMDGVQATNRIRGLPPPKGNLPIVALSLQAEHANRYFAAGMDLCLDKPLSAAALFDAVHTLTANGRPKRSAHQSMPVLDQSAIDALRRFLSAAQLEQLLTESLTDINVHVECLGDCLRRSDAAAALTEAHELISVAGNCGAHALSALARDIERACKQGASASAIQSLSELGGVAGSAIDALKALRDTLMSRT